MEGNGTESFRLVKGSTGNSVEDGLRADWSNN